jgi:hypothetical protein
MFGYARTFVFVAIVCGLSSPAGADEPQGVAEAPARDHVVEPEAAPSFGAIQVPRDLWRFMSRYGRGARGRRRCALLAHAWDDDIVKETQDGP